MSEQVAAAWIGFFGNVVVAAVFVIFGLRLWQQQKLNAVPPLVEARLKAYAPLWHLTEYGPEEEPETLTKGGREARAKSLRAWYYGGDPSSEAATGGGGLLLSDDARRQWTATVACLEDQCVPPNEVWRAMSCLRTRLKQDIHIHDPWIDDSTCRSQSGWQGSRDSRWRLPLGRP